MGLVYPISKFNDRDYVSLIKSLKDTAYARARGKIAVTNIIDRTLRPSDLGLTTNEWTFNVAAGENDIINHTLDDKTLILIYGIFNLSTDPQVTEVKFGTPANTIEDVYIEDMYMYDYPAVILDSPIVFEPGKTIQIKAIAKAANTAEKLGFLGIVIEPAGRNIGTTA